MLYEIRSTIRYQYGDAAEVGHQLLRLVPADGLDDQRLLSAIIDTEVPADEHDTRRDFFGTRVDELVFYQPQRAAEYRLLARVERVDPGPTLDVSVPLAAIRGHIARHHAVDAASPHHFTGASVRVPPSAVIGQWARERTGAGMTVMQAVEAVGLALHADMTFDPDATEVDTPAEDAFAARRGVCQDYAHIMIAALRWLGIPAGYVSGYLRTDPPPGHERLAGADAMHAWVRAWCGPDMGWYEYDPTNARPAGIDHILIGHGRDYADLVPVRGVLRTARRHRGRQTVDVLVVDGLS